jgi:transcriptional regulator with XRE-family HTH domain
VQEFLRTRRARLTPQKANLIAGSNRRVPGLRREEVALLAGVSVDYYAQLERGDLAGVSDEVLDALARALQLDEAETSHLFDLARAAHPRPVRRRRHSRARHPPYDPRSRGPWLSSCAFPLRCHPARAASGVKDRAQAGRTAAPQASLTPLPASRQSPRRKKSTATALPLDKRTKRRSLGAAPRLGGAGPTEPNRGYCVVEESCHDLCAFSGLAVC